MCKYSCKRLLLDESPASRSPCTRRCFKVIMDEHTRGTHDRRLHTQPVDLEITKLHPSIHQKKKKKKISFINIECSRPLSKVLPSRNHQCGDKWFLHKPTLPHCAKVTSAGSKRVKSSLKEPEPGNPCRLRVILKPSLTLSSAV